MHSKTIPGAIIGYRANGCPIRLIAGADLATDTAEPTDYLSKLTAEYDQHLEAIDELVQRAKADHDRALTVGEDEECGRHQEAADKLLPQIERWKNLRETRRQVTELREDLPPASQPVQRSGGEKFVPVAPVAEHEDDEKGLRKIHRSAGVFVRDRFLASRGDTAATERIQRALAKVTTTQTPGLLPSLFTGDVIGRINAVRPVWDSATQVAIPSVGMQWRRPKITQHAKVDLQATEKTEVATQQLTVGSVDVDLKTLAGAVNMSIQEIERTDPSALDLVFADLAALYGRRANKYAVAQLVAGTSTSESVDLDEDADAAAFRAALFEGAGLIYSAVNAMPDVLYASMDQWARIGGWARAINPQDRDVDATPTTLNLSVAGIPTVVSADFDEGTLKLGCRQYFEVAETPGSPVELRALEVGILGWEVGVYGLVGAVVTDAGAFVDLAAPVEG